MDLAADMARQQFWQERTVEELAAEQGLMIPQDVDRGVGEDADLWADDADFEAFGGGIYERRRAGRESDEDRR